jgi:FHS family Na+ dependent glucose MFS transporter 1
MATTGLYYAAFIILGLTSASMGPTLAGLAAHTGSGLDAISALFPARSGGYFLGAFFGGRAYDRWKGHQILLVVLLALAGCLALTPVIPWLWSLAGVLFVLGAAEGVLDVGCNSLLIWLHGDRVGPFMNGLHFFFGFGALLAPLLVNLTMQASGDILWAYWVLALLAVLPAVGLAFCPSPTHQMKAADQVVSGQAAWGLLAPVLLFIFAYVGSELGFANWVYTYVNQTGLGGGNPKELQATAAYLNAGFWGAFTFGRLVSIPIAARFKPGHILLVDLLVCLASAGLILLFPASITALWAGALGLGLGMASIFPVMLVFTGQALNMTGKVTGWFFAAASVGSMFTPWLAGQLIGPLGPQVIVWIVFACLVIDLALLGLIIKPRRVRVASVG